MGFGEVVAAATCSVKGFHRDLLRQCVMNSSQTMKRNKQNVPVFDLDSKGPH